MLDKIFYTLLEDLCGTFPSFLPFFVKDEVEILQEALYHDKKSVLPFSVFLQKLLSKMEPFVIRISEILSYHETKVCFSLLCSF